MNPPAPSIHGLFPEELAEAHGLKAFQGRQLFEWLHAHRASDFESMTSLPRALRAQLAETARLDTAVPVRSQLSPASGTVKTLFRLRDGETVESVLIRDGERVTVCVSSQAGCPLKCSFCATGAAGYRRNLEAGEITAQVICMLREGNVPNEASPNIVYMGMGEPFYNYDAVVRSIRLLMHPGGLAVGARRITVSTAGDVKGIAAFAAEDWQVRLSVSLHAANDALRSELVPLNRRYPLEKLREAVMDYNRRTGRQITFEWTLLADVNDGPEQARELAAFLRRLKAIVNLIPWNPVPGLPHAPATKKRCEAFQQMLEKAGVKATLRREKGGDIDAACGQLRGVVEDEGRSGAAEA